MIELLNINKSFERQEIFNGFNLKVKSGEFVGIVGKSGQGKTTLLNIVGLLDNPDSGTRKINGKTIEGKKIKRLLLRNDIGFIFQNYALIDNATVKENLEIALKYKKMTRAQNANEISLALNEVGLVGFEKKKIYTLSGGEQQRVAIARLIIKNPSLVLADEPTGSLDSDNRDIIVTLFQKLHMQGKTIIMVTHDEDLIQFFSKTIYL